MTVAPLLGYAALANNIESAGNASVTSEINQEIVDRTPVSGQVKDAAGAPIPGVGIKIKGTNSGTVTDLDGNWSLELSGDEILQFTSLGYKTSEMAVDGKTRIDVTLFEDITMLDDVVVVGYGVQNRRDVTTSIASLKADEMANLPNSDFREAMAARMPGDSVRRAAGGQRICSRKRYSVSYFRE